MTRRPTRSDPAADLLETTDRGSELTEVARDGRSCCPRSLTIR